MVTCSRSKAKNENEKVVEGDLLIILLSHLHLECSLALLSPPAFSLILTHSVCLDGHLVQAEALGKIAVYSKSREALGNCATHSLLSTTLPTNHFDFVELI